MAELSASGARLIASWRRGASGLRGGVASCGSAATLVSA